MARIIGGIGASHTPTIGFAKDNKSPDDPDWADVFKMFDPVKLTHTCGADWSRVLSQIGNATPPRTHRGNTIAIMRSGNRSSR